jgi:catechol 2,3-dioxygenase-like lactoylglutathione lyase family enzyme
MWIDPSILHTDNFKIEQDLYLQATGLEVVIQLKITGMDSMVILVKNLDQATTLYSDLLGCGPPKSGPFSKHHAIDRPGLRSKLRMIEMPNNWYIELQEPAEGPKARYLEKNGEGAIYSISLLVDDIEKAYDEMKKRGITPVDMEGPLLDKKYFLGLCGEKLFMLPPDRTGGTRIELVERRFTVSGQGSSTT